MHRRKDSLLQAIRQHFRFQGRCQGKLEEIGWCETDLLPTQVQQNRKSKKEPNGGNLTTDPLSQDERLFEKDAGEFLSELTQRSRTWEGTSSQEVARLQLIGNAISRSGNDDSYLGNHDANLVFQHLRDAKLSDQETRALLDCGVVGFEHQNVPLWRWIAQSELGNNPFYRLRILATVGTNVEKGTHFIFWNYWVRPSRHTMATSTSSVSLLLGSTRKQIAVFLTLPCIFFPPTANKTTFRLSKMPHPVARHIARTWSKERLLAFWQSLVPTMR